MAKSNLVVRLATAAVGVPILLGVLYLGPHWGWFVLVAVAVVVGSLELFAMTHRGDRVAQWLGALMALSVSLSIYFGGNDARVLATVIVVVPIVAMLVPLWRLGDISTAAIRVAAGAFGPLYIGGCLTTLALVRRDHPGSEGAGFAVLALSLAWLSDTGGYFVGKWIGRRPLYVAVSPKKTVAGLVGGSTAALAGAIVAHVWFLPSLPLVHAVMLGLIGSLAGQAGDLGESLLKRSSGVKDSGVMVPGHGGILDRVDALMVTSTAVYLYSLWW